VSWRSRFLAGAAALGALGAISVAALAVGVVQAGGSTQLAGATILTAGPATIIAAGPTTAVTYQVSGAAQRRALDYWTSQRMLSAASSALPQALARTETPPAVLPMAPQAQAQARLAQAVRAPRIPPPPEGIPTATLFGGSPTIGALLSTVGRKARFCTAAVVDSTAGDLVLTAAHCVNYKESLASHIAFVPDYNGGKPLYGEWPVRSITVASGWQRSHNPDVDLAFLTVGPLDGQQIQARTGGLTMGFNQGYDQKMEAVAYDNAYDQPVRCATKSFMFRTGQMEFHCQGFSSGTSGAPWILGYNPKNGTGTMFGLIGGYEGGGRWQWTSYSPYFGAAARALYERAETPPAPSATGSATTAYLPRPSQFH
jgi:V8-like Glu-specific endopeptidase